MAYIPTIPYVVDISVNDGVGMIVEAHNPEEAEKYMRWAFIEWCEGTAEEDSPHDDRNYLRHRPYLMSRLDEFKRELVDIVQVTFRD